MEIHSVLPEERARTEKGETLPWGYRYAEQVKVLPSSILQLTNFQLRKKRSTTRRIRPIRSQPQHKIHILLTPCQHKTRHNTQSTEREHGSIRLHATVHKGTSSKSRSIGPNHRVGTRFTSPGECPYRVSSLRVCFQELRVESDLPFRTDRPAINNL